MNKIAFTFFLTLLSFEIFSQTNARMFQHPDVSETHICFVYAGDIWIAPKDGGTAVQLSSPKGAESFPKFSPDGKSIAFSGNYGGNVDVYTIPTAGGVPFRLTYHGMSDRVLGWHPDGEKVLFNSSRESGKQRFGQFYTVSRKGGLAEKLPIAYGEFASYAPDGDRVAFTDRSRVFRTWKRYRGGAAPDILLFDLKTLTHQNITSNASNDEVPMWHNNKIYYLSDEGPSKRYNIWVYDLDKASNTQLTKFTEFDIHFPSIGHNDLVFEAGGDLYLMNLSDEKYKKLNINVITDNISTVTKNEKVANYVKNGWVSPDGNRVVIEARGDLFSLPAEKGYVKNLTNSSGTAERSPSWSPDGKKIAFWSDESGEYELYIYDRKSDQKRKLTNYGPGFRYHIFWSPDSKKLAFVEQTQKIRVFDTETNATTDIDKGLWMAHGGLSNFQVSWSSDSRWIAYSRGLANRHNAIFVFDMKNKSRHQLTSGFYHDYSPAFDPDGKYLYFLTNRSLSPVYSDMDNTFIYPNTTQLAAASLRKDVPSPMAPENDEVEVKEDDKDKAPEKGSKKKKNGDKEDDKKDDDEKPVEIALDGFEERMVILPPAPGNYNNVQAVSGKVIYQQYPNSGSREKKSPVKYFDLEERKEKSIIDNSNFYQLAANGKKMLVRQDSKIAIIDVKPNQKIEKKVPMGDMEMAVNPKEEWKQIFNDSWRFQRDYFYDKKMHGVDWDGMRLRYGALIDEAITRWDVNYVIGELIGELNASHTYRFGGDIESSNYRNVGYLGVDWEIVNGYYRIKHIVNGAPWDAEVRSPLALPGVDVNEGDYVLAVNGVKMDITKDPAAAFQGLANKTVALTINSAPTKSNSRTEVVKPLRSEARLRHLEWINANRLTVEKATNGRVGYVYVPSTGRDGQNELIRQFLGQIDKEGLIIDERFNNGGQIPDRFVEMLNRKPLAYWAVRDGKDWAWPPFGHFGPKAMLINGWAGSGGDAFPDYFRKLGIGPLIGARTWGGLIGISGVPSLIDGGGVTVPTFSMYDPDGEWFKEGHGVDPDIEVLEDPGKLAQGIDTQLERAIEYMNDQLKNKPYVKPEHKPYRTR
ncbi:PDZ domain-containing protein [Fulvivirgaceae bacterium BMA12]|uniref:Tricorn protease homolog n=1 Tax=Agaribacillus aureus TaxID=3051825 RepID=A0ABT8L711_9BACT|nr:PDZ domain-containing protein [Fulvivirgaceae bacterium BMA12]